MDRAWFLEERTPADFYERANALGNLDHRDFFGPGHSWMREAFILAEISSKLGADWVKLCQEDPPDGQMRWLNTTFDVECTELIRSGRKRVQELETLDREGISDDDSEWLNKDGIDQYLRITLDRKVSGSCFKGCALIFVYVNLGFTSLSVSLDVSFERYYILKERPFFGCVFSKGDTLFYAETERIKSLIDSKD